MARGRPVASAPLWECHIHLRLRVGEDDDLIAFLQQSSPRMRVSVLKAALRAGGTRLAPVDDTGPDDEMFAALDDFLK